MQYPPIRRRFRGGQRAGRGSPPTLGELFLIRDDLPWFKADFNNRGPFSTDYIGKSWDYPNAGYARREEIWLAVKEENRAAAAAQADALPADLPVPPAAEAGSGTDEP